MTGWIVLSLVVLVVLFWAVGAYKRLVRLQDQARQAFAQVGAHLKCRHELVPGLVETAGACLKQERETLEAVVDACNQAIVAHPGTKADASDSDALGRMASAEAALSAALAGMFSLTGAHPVLKADGNMARLREELAAAERRIAFARQVYDEGAMHYNASRDQFPSSIIAGVFAFKRAVPLKADDTSGKRRTD